jgi:hypothetical protein
MGSWLAWIRDETMVYPECVAVEGILISSGSKRIEL